MKILTELMNLKGSITRLNLAVYLLNLVFYRNGTAQEKVNEFLEVFSLKLFRFLARNFP